VRDGKKLSGPAASGTNSFVPSNGPYYEFIRLGPRAELSAYKGACMAQLPTNDQSFLLIEFF
jgi:hypothetical protein